MRSRPASALVAATATLLAAVTPCVCQAQKSATYDAGLSWVHYDGFLGAAAASLSSALGWRSPRSSFGIRGSILAFETGHLSIQALAGGGVLSRPRPGSRVRYDASGEVATSVYENVAQSAHVLGAGRLHLPGDDADFWIGPTAGLIASGTGSAAAWGAMAGATVRLDGGALTLSVSRMGVGDTAFSDAEAGLRLGNGSVALTASGGIRFASSAEQGAYGDGSLSWSVSEGLALVLAGGRYPSDPVRGTIAGSYFTVGFQLRGRSAAAPERIALLSDRVAMSIPRTAVADSSQPAAAATMRFELVGGAYLLTLDAPAAGRAEIMGDFTGWDAAALLAAGPGRFVYRVPLASGLYRFNVRIDGGPWMVPGGVDSAADEFGSRAAIIVIP